jgi:hypothetical protein
VLPDILMSEGDITKINLDDLSFIFVEVFSATKSSTNAIWWSALSWLFPVFNVDSSSNQL